MADNYASVLEQLRVEGLIVEHIVLDKLTRCNADGAKKNAGWYNLKEITLRKGNRVIVGYFGVNRGADHGTSSIKLDGSFAQDKEDAEIIKKRLAEAAKEEAARRKIEIEHASLLAELVFFNSKPINYV